MIIFTGKRARYDSVLLSDSDRLLHVAQDLGFNQTTSLCGIVQAVPKLFPNRYSHIIRLMGYVDQDQDEGKLVKCIDVLDSCDDLPVVDVSSILSRHL